jgi:hypothetical protein
LARIPRLRPLDADSGGFDTSNQRRLRVSFSNGGARIYDCTPLLAESAFRELADEGFFRNVRAAPHGFGIVWNDQVDLSESELWINGTAETEVTGQVHAK